MEKPKLSKSWKTVNITDYKKNQFQIGYLKHKKCYTLQYMSTKRQYLRKQTRL